MSKVLLVITLLSIAALSFGCGGGAPANANSNTAVNGNTAVKIDPANMPPGFSNVNVAPSGNSTPGIPPVVTNLPKGATPTPGIPSEAELKKGMKPGVTPTPGIPSEAELRKAMGIKPTNVNTVPQATSDAPMMKKNTNKIRRPQ